MMESRFDNSNRYEFQPTSVGSFSKLPSSNMFNPTDTSQAMLFISGDNYNSN